MTTTIKTWTKPERPEVWARYSSKTSFLYILALAGNLISGWSEYNSMDKPIDGILAVLLIEGGVWFAGAMFFDNLFRFLRDKKDGTSAVFGSFGLLMLIAVLWMSINLSNMGIGSHIDKTPPPVEVRTDSSKYNSLVNKALAVYISDSTRAVSENFEQKEAERSKLNDIVSSNKAKKAKIMAYGDYNYTKYKSSIVKLEQNIKSAQSEIYGLEKKYKALLDNELAKAKSKQSGEFASATTVLVGAIDTANMVNAGLWSGFEENKAEKKFMLSLIMKFGVLATIFYLFYVNLGRYLSGSYPEYHDPFQNVLPPFQRMGYGIKLIMRKGFEWIADKVAPSDTVEVLNKGLKFKLTDSQSVIVTNSGDEEPFIPAPAATPIGSFAPSPPLSVATMQVGGEEPSVIPTPAPMVTHGSGGIVGVLVPVSASKTCRPIGYYSDNNLLDTKKEDTKVFEAQSIEVEKEDGGGAELAGEEEVLVMRDGEEYQSSTKESVEEIEERLKVFDYTKHARNLINTYDKMRKVADGETKKIAGWESTVVERALKVMQLANDLVYQGYRVTEYKDDKGLWKLNIDDVSNPSMATLAEKDRKVKVFSRNNENKFPILFEYADKTA